MTEAVQRRDGTGERGGVAPILRRMVEHRELLTELVHREIVDAYAGSMLARGWALLHPILMIGVYVFVFGYVFTTRLGAQLPAEPDFAVFILSGLSAWLTVQTALAKGANALVTSANLVKQVVFPVELLPLRAVFAAHLPMLVGLALVILYTLARFHTVSLMLPLIIYPIVAQAMLLAGLGLFLSALTVFVRDARDVVQVFSAFGVFLLPVIYLPGALPGWFEGLLYLNPFSYAIWCFQDVLFFWSFRHPAAWIVVGPLGALTLHFGHRFFQRVRGGFGDVI